MGFTLGGVEQLNDPDVLLVLALDSEGHVHGVTSWLPVYRDGMLVGYILDFMRRDPRDSGRSLNSSSRRPCSWPPAEMLSGSPSRVRRWRILRGCRGPLARRGAEGPRRGRTVFSAQPWTAWGWRLSHCTVFAPLAAFKRKFHPEYQPWLLCYRDELSLPAIGVALGRCYVPQLHVTGMVDIAREWRANNR